MEMTEHAVQSAAVSLLRKRGVTFFAVPNGGLRNKATAAKLWREGVQAGVPDLIILDPPPTQTERPYPAYVGLAVEIKTETGRPSKQQLDWLSQFSARCWATRITYGLAELLTLLRDYGYLETADIAPWLRLTPTADDGSDVQDRTAVRQSGSGAAPTAATVRRRGMPSRGRGVEG